MSTCLKITRQWDINVSKQNPIGTPTNVTSMILSDKLGTYGIRKMDGERECEVVVPAGVPFTNVSTGVYQYLFESAVPGVTYKVATQVAYNNATNQFYNYQGLPSQTIVPLETVLMHLELHEPKKHEIAWINAVQPRVEQLIKKRLGYDPIYGCRTEYMPPTYGYRRQDVLVRDFDVRGNRLVTESGDPTEGADELVMPSVPIRCIRRLWENREAFGGQACGDFSDAYLLFDGKDYYIDWQDWGMCKSGVLRRIYAHWPVRPRTVKVEYETGYTQDELCSGIASGIGLAVLVSMQYYFWSKGKNYLTETSESIGGYSVSYAAAVGGSLPREAQKILSPYLHYGRFL